MRTKLAGSRSILNYRPIDRILNDIGYQITTVISGTSIGVDRIGERWAEMNGIPVERYPADWEKYGRSAGHIRNDLMASRADMLIAFWDGRSKGTKSMIDIAMKRGLKTLIFFWEDIKDF